MSTTEIKNKYLVSGGNSEIFETTSYYIAMKNYLKRIDESKPFTNETITITQVGYIGDLWVAYRIVHRVVLS